MKNKTILKNPCIPKTIKCASEARHAHSLYHFLKSAKKRDAKCEKHATLEVHSMWTYQDQIMS